MLSVHSLKMKSYMICDPLIQFVVLTNYHCSIGDLSRVLDFDERRVVIKVGMVS